MSTLENTRTCKVCKRVKPLTAEYWPSAKYKTCFDTRCRACELERSKTAREMRKWVKENIGEKTECEVCGSTENKRLSIDHCHGTGYIRGQLCNMCNTALGKLKDNQEIVYKLYQYLNKEPIKWRS